MLSRILFRSPETISQSSSSFAAWNTFPFIPSHIMTFLALQMTGLVGFTIILLTGAISTRIRSTRYATWYSFCAAFMMSCASYLMLLVTGKAYERDRVPYGLCAVQAGLIYAAPTLIGLATAALSIEMKDNFCAVINRDPMAVPSRIKRILLIAIPWSAWFIFYLGIMIYGVQKTGRVQRAADYCVTVSDVPSKIAAFIVILAMLIIILTQAFIGRQLLVLHKTGLSRSKPYMSMGIRMLLFGLVAALCVIIGFVFVIGTRRRDFTYDVILALVPIFGVLIFGTQSDLIKVWMFWRKPVEPAKFEIE